MKINLSKLSSASATAAPKKVVLFLQSVFGFKAKAANTIAQTLTILSKEKIVATGSIDSFLAFARSSTKADIEFASGRKSITNLKPVLVALAKAKTFEATLANVNKFKFNSPIASTKPSVQASPKKPVSAISVRPSIAIALDKDRISVINLDVSVESIVGETLDKKQFLQLAKGMMFGSKPLIDYRNPRLVVGLINISADVPSKTITFTFVNPNNTDGSDRLNKWSKPIIDWLRKYKDLQTGNTASIREVSESKYYLIDSSTKEVLSVSKGTLLFAEFKARLWEHQVQRKAFIEH